MNGKGGTMQAESKPRGPKFSIFGGTGVKNCDSNLFGV